MVAIQDIVSEWCLHNMLCGYYCLFLSFISFLLDFGDVYLAPSTWLSSQGLTLPYSRVYFNFMHYFGTHILASNVHSAKIQFGQVYLFSQSALPRAPVSDPLGMIFN